ncbi:DNA topoisomerase 1 alpha [Trifolium repens]|nr:DNA topoisomerase 1 alpha [Trifolium repens]
MVGPVIAKAMADVAKGVVADAISHRCIGKGNDELSLQEKENIATDAPIHECPIPGKSWKEIRHDSTVTWLAYWNDPINPKLFKYVEEGSVSCMYCQVLLILESEQVQQNLWKREVDVEGEGEDTETVMKSTTHHMFCKTLILALMNKFISKVKKPISKRRHVKGESCEDTPNSLYWRNKGVVTGVRDQGNCGSFWSLSSSGAIEGVNAIVTGGFSGAGSGAGGRQIKGIGRGFDDGGARGAGGRGRGGQGGKPGGSRGAG